MTRYWYEGFLGLRYLRAAPRPGFVSLIAGIAMIGLALGVAVLIVVLSVMNGFEEELRTRILSLTAHATIAGLGDLAMNGFDSRKIKPETRIGGD